MAKEQAAVWKENAAAWVSSIRKIVKRIHRIVKAADDDFDTGDQRRQYVFAELDLLQKTIGAEWGRIVTLESDARLGVTKAKRMAAVASRRAKVDISLRIDPQEKAFFVNSHTHASADEKERLGKCFDILVINAERKRLLDDFIDSIHPDQTEDILSLISGVPHAELDQSATEERKRPGVKKRKRTAKMDYLVRRWQARTRKLTMAEFINDEFRGLNDDVRRQKLDEFRVVVKTAQKAEQRKRAALARD